MLSISASVVRPNAAARPAAGAAPALNRRAAVAGLLAVLPALVAAAPGELPVVKGETGVGSRLPSLRERLVRTC